MLKLFGQLLVAVVGSAVVLLALSAGSAFATVSPEGKFTATSEGKATLTVSGIGSTECEATLTGELISNGAGEGAHGTLESLTNKNCTSIVPVLLNTPVIELEEEVSPSLWHGSILEILISATVPGIGTCDWHGEIPLSYNNAGVVTILTNSLAGTPSACGTASASGKFKVSPSFKLS